MSFVLKIGDDAPEVSLPNVTGNDWKLSEQNGKMCVMYFARGEYCPTTRGEFANYNSFAHLFKQMNCELVFVVNGGRAEHAQFAQEFKMRIPILIDSDGAVAEKYGVYGVNHDDMKRDDYKNYNAPGVYLVNSDGKIGGFWLSSTPRGMPTPESLLSILVYAQNHDWKY